MTNKINGNPGIGPLRPSGGVKSAKGARKTEAAKGGDKVAFSDVLKDVHRAQGSAGAEDPQRAAKIEALQQQIDSGTYRPDLNKVAVSLLKYVAGGR